MVEAAKELGAKLIVVNTTGMVDGYAARKLKTHKIDLVRPDYLVGIQKGFEIDPLLIPFARMRSLQIIRIKTPAQVRSKSQEYRKARRKLQFASEFSDALGHIIKLDSVSLWNTCFRAGRPLTWQYIKSIEEAIDCRILHAEIAGNTVFAVAEQTCKTEAHRLLQEKFPSHNMLLATTDCFTNLLCGLADENGNTLDVGLIQAVDFKRMFIFVLSGIKTISPIRVVQIGSVRISRDGRELGTLKPGEI
jgi:polynucleotide 5'-kinase involved in rRNA processing